MKEFIKYALIFLSANAIFLFLLIKIIDGSDISDGILIFLVFIISLIIQLVLAVWFTTTATKSEVGKGMLLACGIILLVGISFCSGVFNLNV